jgi:hypothetical protein
MEERRNAYTILMGKPLGRPKRRSGGMTLRQFLGR